MWHEPGEFGRPLSDTYVALGANTEPGEVQEGDKALAVGNEAAVLLSESSSKSMVRTGLMFARQGNCACACGLREPRCSSARGLARP